MDSLAKYEQTTLGGEQQLPVEEILKNRRARYQSQLDDLDKALFALERNPELKDMLNLLRRVGL